MKCQFCNKVVTKEKEGRLKDVCRKCYNQVYYFDNWEKLIEKSKKVGTSKKDYSYYKEYFKRNPDKKRLLHIRQQTFHKYGKAKKCVFCEIKKKVEHHHFIPYDVDNFIDLCVDCHRKNFHRKELKARIIGDKLVEKSK